MRAGKRVVKSTGETYYSFIYYDSRTKKPVRITREEVRRTFKKDIRTEAELDECIRILSSKVDSAQLRYQRQLEWRKEYILEDKLVSEFSEYQKKKARNSWENTIHYLNYYVVKYFTGRYDPLRKSKNNPNLWSLHFEDFTRWITEEARLVKNPDKLLSNASKNHCIKALSVFLRWLKKTGRLTEIELCEYIDFKDSELNKKDVDDLISDEEFEIVFKSLLNANHRREAFFYRFLFFAGMRFNEALGVSLGCVFKGRVDDDFVSKMLMKYKDGDKLIFDHPGRVVLESQPSSKNRSQRNPTTNKVDRKPLKGKRDINEKYSRIIPIIDNDLWEYVWERVRATYGEWKKGAFGSDKKDYLIFDGVDKTTFATRLKKAFLLEKLKYRSAHCARHSRGTWLYSVTGGDRELSKIWLGHTSDKIFENYNHTLQRSVRQTRSKDQFEELEKELKSS